VSVAGSRPRLLYVVTEDWYFLSHRLPMARAARDAGFEVHVATNVVDGGAEIERQGFSVHHLPFARGRISIRAVLTIGKLHQLYRLLAPQIVHHVALQPTVLGGVAALGLPITCVNALTGLGYIFTAKSPKARLLRAFVTPLLSWLLNRPETVVLVQNPDDRLLLSSLGIQQDRITLIAGSGVDVSRLQPLPEPGPPVTVGFAGRLLGIKGIRTLIAAQRLLRSRGANFNLLVAGAPDPANPGSVSARELGEWKREAGVTFLGHVGDIGALWRQAHIAALPSEGGEGVPMSLLEAAAFGRPLIATDVPGCREVVIPNKTGMFVPVDDPPALAGAIEELAASPELRARYGAAARQLVVEKFSADAVGRAVADLYFRLTVASAARARL
jgi:glycosyltransferase involved in cell wall biosynthesis